MFGGEYSLESMYTRFLEFQQTEIFSLEYLVKGDKLYFLEINLRNDGNGYSPTFGGVNLPYLWAMDAVGEDMSQYPRIITKSFHAQVESTDFSYLKKNPTKILSWLIDTVRTECYMVANKKDIEPWNEIVRHKNIFIKYPYKYYINYYYG